MGWRERSSRMEWPEVLACVELQKTVNKGIKKNYLFICYILFITQVIILRNSSYNQVQEVGKENHFLLIV